MKQFSLSVAMPRLGYGSHQKGTGREQPGRIWFDLATWHRINTLYDRKTVAEIGTMLLDAVSEAGVQPDNIDALFYTGGSSLVPLLRQRIGACFSERPGGARQRIRQRCRRACYRRGSSRPK